MIESLMLLSLSNSFIKSNRDHVINENSNNNVANSQQCQSKEKTLIKMLTTWILRILLSSEMTLRQENKIG